MVAHQGYLYILHFRTPLATGNKSSQHYAGWAKNWFYRVQAHRQGTSRARMIEVAHDRGLEFEVAVVVKRIVVHPGTPDQLILTGRAMEQWIKRQHKHSRFCPLCGSNRLTDYRLEQVGVH